VIKNSVILFTANTGFFFQALGIVYMFFWHPNGYFDEISPPPWLLLIFIGFIILTIAVLFEVVERVSTRSKMSEV
jgi:H+/Cl- antiporter ClcA